MSRQDEAFKKNFKDRLKTMLKGDFDRALDEFVEKVVGEREVNEGYDESVVAPPADAYTFKVEKQFSQETVNFIRGLLG